jgi:hypothetical protein
VPIDLVQSLHLPPALTRWMAREGTDPVEAWATIPRASWLVHLALALDLDRRRIVAAVHHPVAAHLQNHRVRDLRPARALRTARKWLDDEATGAEAWARGFAAMDAAEQSESPARRAAIRAAAAVAFACDEAADAAFYAHEGHAARAIESIESLLDDEAVRRVADDVRRRIGAAPVLSAFERLLREAQLVTVEPPAPDSGSDDEQELA